ncbi:MAG: hypothetical protein ACLRM8_00690 [Alistipes sp.]
MRYRTANGPIPTGATPPENPVLNSTTAAISSANDRASINLNVNYHNNQDCKKDSYERTTPTSASPTTSTRT